MVLVMESTNVACLGVLQSGVSNINFLVKATEGWGGIAFICYLASATSWNVKFLLLREPGGLQESGGPLKIQAGVRSRVWDFRKW